MASHNIDPPTRRAYTRLLRSAWQALTRLLCKPYQPPDERDAEWYARHVPSDWVEYEREWEWPLWLSTPYYRVLCRIGIHENEYGNCFRCGKRLIGGKSGAWLPLRGPIVVVACAGFIATAVLAAVIGYF